MPEVSSTNDYLKKELSKSTPFTEGTVIMAVHQTQGRGQHGATWMSESGKNLTCSILLYPKSIHPSKSFLLTAAISLAIVKTLNPHLPKPAQIKWPNDIFFENKKIAGILIENTIKGNIWKSAIIGIGININQENFPTPIAKHTTSIKLITKKTFNITDLLHQMCIAINYAYLDVLNNKTTNLLSNYKKHLFRFSSETFYWMIDGVKVPGSIADILDNGRLVMDFNGYRVDFGTKEISYIL